MYLNQGYKKLICAYKQLTVLIYVHIQEVIIQGYSILEHKYVPTWLDPATSPKTLFTLGSSTPALLCLLPDDVATCKYTRNMKRLLT